MNRVTIRDVANRAGVSKTTVSHVLNQTRVVDEATREKVLRAVEELGYRPSQVARSLISKRTKTAGLLISDVSNPFYPDVILGVEEVAFAEDYSIFLCNTNYDLERGLKLVQSLVDRSVDGILFMSSSMSLQMVREATENQVHAVVLDWEDSNLHDIASTITINFESGIQQAIRHLVEAGHRHIAHISGPLNLWTAQVRKNAFLKALELNGVDPQQAPIIEGDLRIEGGRKAFEQLNRMTPRPTAVVAANDLMALGVLWAARNAGLDLPQDLSVVGLDDIDLASKVSPSLSTIALPRREIGKIAMQMLLDMIREGKEAKRSRVTVDSTFVLRQSTQRVG
ncbi:MAG: LacI family DNA-binding transcriptional regulator [Anaerolineales bacterium]|nr:LacI family transcriptional regulator [Anaerolineales bacterium]MDW8446475.1 LacI family DNA-binding transcriptional regulator [Anaerolineales bacterium]